MDGCINTEKDIDKLLTKYDIFKKDSFSKLIDLGEQVSKLQEELSHTDPDAALSKSHQLLISQSNKKIKLTSQKVSAQHKELHGCVSRIGKAIDRNFDSECHCIAMPEILSDQNQQKLLNTALCEHFFRQGSLAVADHLAKDCSLEFDDKWKEPYVEMKNIMQSLRNKDVEPALQWVHKNEDELNKRNSTFCFKLHRLKFLQILEKGTSYQAEALQYSKHFQKFVPSHSHEIQQLMGCFLYLKQGFLKSPYASLFSEDAWDDICIAFSQEACKLIGISFNSPLQTAFSAGCQVLPALVTLRSVIEQRQCSGLFANIDELPIDIELDSQYHYHSVFACPILRQQTTTKNPPMRLVCGHVISKEALDKLASSSKVKCPYCPIEQPPNEAKQIFY